LLGPGPAAPAVNQLELWFFPKTPSRNDFTGILVPEGLGWQPDQDRYGVSLYSAAISHR